MKRFFVLMTAIILACATLLSPALADETDKFDAVKKTSGNAEYMLEVVRLVLKTKPETGSGWVNNSGVIVCFSPEAGTVRISAENAEKDRVCYTWGKKKALDTDTFYGLLIALLVKYERIEKVTGGPVLFVDTDTASVFDNADEAMLFAQALYFALN